MSDQERKNAEQAYVESAHDYANNPVGSRDWCLFWNGYRAALAQQAVPKGWKPVPVEPTDAMRIAGGIAHESSPAHDVIGPLVDAWAAMLAAAPAAPQAEQQAVPHRASIEDAATKARKLAHGRDAAAYRDAVADLGRAYLAEFPTRTALAAQQAEREPLTDEQIDRAIAELGLNYLANVAVNREVLRGLCRRAHGIGKEGQS